MDRSRSFVAAQAIQEFVTLNEWQIGEIKKALVEADRGDIASDERERKRPPTEAAYFGFSAFMCRTYSGFRKEKGTATTSTADTPRRSPPRAVGCVRPLICSAS